MLKICPSNFCHLSENIKLNFIITLNPQIYVSSTLIRLLEYYSRLGVFKKGGGR